MLKVFNLRVAIITAIFGAFGFALIKIVDIDNMPEYSARIGMVFSVILSFICSTLLVSRLSRRRRRFFIFLAVVLFILSVAMFLLLQFKIDTLTVELKDFVGDSTIVHKSFKGKILMPEALVYKKANPLASDGDLLMAFENDVDNVWTSDSIKSVGREVTLTYYVFIFSIILAISILGELMLKKRSKASSKTNSKSSGIKRPNPK